MNFQAVSTLKRSINNIRIDFIPHRDPYVKAPIMIEGIRMASQEDIAAMKTNAISGDGTRSKDFIDIYFLLKTFSLREIIGFYTEKYRQGIMPMP